MSINTRDIVRTAAPRITVSSVQDMACPKKYKHTRIDRNWGKRDVIYAVANGLAVHAVLHDLYGDRCGYELNLTRLPAQAMDAVWATKWPQGTNRQQAVGRVITSVHAFVDADDEEAISGTLDIERQGQFPVTDKKTGEVLFVVSATLDRTLIRASESHRLIVRESKTTAQKISLKEAFLQLWVARKMYSGIDSGMDLTSWAVEYDFLDEDYRVVRETVEWEDVMGQSAIILQRAMRVLYATEYPAVPGSQCTYCSLRDDCTSLPGEGIDSEAMTGDSEAQS